MNSSNSKLIEAEVACRMGAERKSRFGDGSWSWVKFGRFSGGDDYIKTGRLRMKDVNVTFPTGQGGQVRSEVSCAYDLNAGKIESVFITEQE